MTFLATAPLAERMLAFVRDAATCRTMPELEAMAVDCMRSTGMTAIASGMLTGPARDQGQVFHFNNWPAAWMALYRDRGFLEKDPLPRWALVSGAPVLWSQVIARMSARDPGQEVLAAARAFGFHEGVLTPVRSGGGHLGLVSIGGGRASITADEFSFLQVISSAALHRAEELLGDRVADPPRLSRREMECVTLLTQGLTERETSQRLGIRDVTVRFHLDNARLKTGARSRTHLAGIAASWPGHTPD